MTELFAQIPTAELIRNLLHERNVHVDCFAIVSAGAFDLLRFIWFVALSLVILKILGQFNHDLFAFFRLRLGSEGENEICKIVTGATIIGTLEQVNVKFTSLSKEEGESYGCTFAVLPCTTFVTADECLLLWVGAFGLALAILVMALFYVRNLTRKSGNVNG